MGGVHGYGVGGADDDDLSAPLGTFGNTGGHRQDLDSAGAYVVAGPQGEDVSHALGATETGNRHNETQQTYVAHVPANEEAATLTSGSHPNSNAPGRKHEDDENLVVYPIYADAVGRTGESDTPSVDAGGHVRTRRPGLGVGEEGDPSFTLSATAPPAVAVGFNAEQDDTGISGDEVSPPVSSSKGTTPNAVAFDLRGREEGVQVEEQGDETSALRSSPGGSSRSYVAFRQTPQGDIGVDPEAAYPVMTGDGGAGNNRNLLATTEEVSGTLKGQRGKGGGGIGPEETLVATGFKTDGSESDMTLPIHEGTPPLRTQGTTAVAYTKTHGAADDVDAELWDEAQVSRTLDKTAFATTAIVEGEVAETLRQHPRPGSNSNGALAPGAAVRRLTPTECERLQGFPDDWTLLEPPDAQGKGGTADGARYAALGDAVTVNVGYWVVRRIMRRRELGLE